MTRGKGYIITDEMIYSSTEFNGDMYPEGHGRDFIKRLSKVRTKEEFIGMLLDFNESEHGYPEEEVREIYEDTESFAEFEKWHTIDMTKDYFGRFFSDWTFFKNLSHSDVTFNLSDGKGEEEVLRARLHLRVGETVAINFGSYKRHYFRGRKKSPVKV